MELLAETYERFNIPLIGPQLESELEAARVAPRERWAGPVELTLTVSLPQLEAFWARVQPALLLPPELRPRLLAAVDEGVAGLYAAYQALQQPDCSDAEGLELLEQAMTAASAAFSELQQACLPVEGLTGTLAGAYVETVRGILGGTVPDQTLASMVANDPPPGEPEVRRYLLEYLAGGSPDLLCLALERMLEGLTREQAPAELSCPVCGASNPAEASRCEGCGGRLRLTGQVWEG